MAFVGIYSTETYEPLAVADREHIETNPAEILREDQTRKLLIEIKPYQVKAIVRHIRTRDNPMTQIEIANLRFVCLRNENGYMTGVSKFNMDRKRESIHLERMSSILLQNYTSKEVLDGVDALQISAILKEELIIIGFCSTGHGSPLKLLKTVFEEPTEHVTTKPNNEKRLLNIGGEYRDNRRNESDNVFETQLGKNTQMNIFGEKPPASECFFPPNDTEYCYNAQDPFGMPDVELRHPGLTAEEKKGNREKRDTSFCEDWRTTTVKSIEALRLIGPFRAEDEFSDRDDKPLIENAVSIDMSPGPQSTEMVSTEGQEEPDARDAPLVRRPSRATMV